jgi:hypothetical protein
MNLVLKEHVTIFVQMGYHCISFCAACGAAEAVLLPEPARIAATAEDIRSRRLEGTDREEGATTTMREAQDIRNDMGTVCNCNIICVADLALHPSPHWNRTC